MIAARNAKYLAEYTIFNRDPDATWDDADYTIVKMLIDCIGDHIRRVERLGTWLRWCGYCWREVDSIEPEMDSVLTAMDCYIRNFVKDLHKNPQSAAQQYREWKRMPADFPAEMAAKNLEDLINVDRAILAKIKNNAGRNAIRNMLGQYLTVNPEDLDRNTDMVVFRNGCYNARTGEFGPNDPLQLATLAIDLEYAPPDDESRANLQEYLRDLGFDSATIKFLQRSFGYALTGRGTEKRFWWFRGETNTSKTTLIELVYQCAGHYGGTTMCELWQDSKSVATGHQEDLARLRGKRIVTAHEFKKNSRFDDAKMKRMTSGTGSINASRKGEKSIEFQCTFGLFFSSNYDAQIAEDDVALHQRLTTLTFTVPISEDIKDPQFVANFLARGDNRLAMIEWLLEGAREYCAEGLGQEPQQVRESRKEFMEQQVTITEQLSELLQSDPGSVGTKRLRLTDVLSALEEHQKATRQRCQYSRNEVIRAVTKQFSCPFSKTNGISGFDGVKLRAGVNRPRSQGPHIDTRLDWVDEQFDPFQN